MPKSILGKWAVGLIVAMFILFFLGSSFTNWIYQSIPAGNTILEDISRRPALALTMLTAMLSGILAFITGLIAIFKLKDRSPLVWIAMIIGGLLIIFLIGEFISPH